MIVFDIPDPQFNPALLAMAAGAFVGVAFGFAGEVARIIHGYYAPNSCRISAITCSPKLRPLLIAMAAVIILLFRLKRMEIRAGLER